MISIIIPLYNKGNIIQLTLNSILAQSYKDFEVIIVDDGSTDESKQMLLPYLENENIKYIYQTNKGVSAARNAGAQQAKGEWILFLDADDPLYPNALEILISTIKKAPNASIISAKYHSKKNNSIKINNSFRYEGFVKNKYKWLFQNRYSLRMGCFTIKRNYFLKFTFNEKLSRFEDMEAILRWIKEASIYITPHPIMIYNQDTCALSKASSVLEKDFVFNLQFKNKPFWEKCKLGELFYFGLLSYPNQKKILIQKYYQYIPFILIAKLNLISRKIWTR